MSPPQKKIRPKKRTAAKLRSCTVRAPDGFYHSGQGRHTVAHGGG